MVNKKGIAELVTYVLLISLAIAMAGIVYAWINFYVKAPFPEQSCPDVSLVIRNYSCADDIFSLNIQNKGRFDVDGYMIKINNGTRDYNVYDMRGFEIGILSGETALGAYNFSLYKSVKEIEIEAFKGKDKNNKSILCSNSVIRQSIDNCLSVSSGGVSTPSGGSNIPSGGCVTSGNVALSKTYQVSPQPSSNVNYLDYGNSQLTNGLIREDLYYGMRVNEATVGWAYDDPTITIDLGSSKQINETRIYFGGGGDGGINTPQSVDVSTSADNSTWSSLTSKTISPDAEQWVGIPVQPVNARYVRIQTHNSYEWTMIGEIYVIGC